MSQAEEMQELINFCGLPYIFFPLRNPAIFGLFLLHELELVSSLEKEPGTFLRVICNKEIVILSYQLIKTANVKRVVKRVLAIFSYCN